MRTTTWQDELRRRRREEPAYLRGFCAQPFARAESELLRLALLHPQLDVVGCGVSPNGHTARALFWGDRVVGWRTTWAGLLRLARAVIGETTAERERRIDAEERALRTP
jgi:hypothetical protein